MLEPTIVGNKLSWTDGVHKWGPFIGVPVVAPGPVDPPPPPPVPTGTGIWLSRKEIEALPDTGAAWQAVLAAASKPPGTPDLSNQDSAVNVNVLAQALVYVRTGLDIHKEAVLGATRSIITTTKLGRTLALGREFAAYVVAADLVGLPDDLRAQFEAKLWEIMGKTLEDDRTLAQCHEQRPNNWGTHAGASRAAVAAYLGDKAELDRCAAVFKGWLGDRSSYAGFKYGDLAWQADPANPVGINPVGATKQGFNIDGVIPDDMRRSSAFSTNPSKPNYPYGALDGACVCAEILHRQGYPAWEWEDRALLRAVQWLTAPGRKWVAEGDNAWHVALINHAYGTDFTVANNEPGKNMGWTQWSHQ